MLTTDLIIPVTYIFLIYYIHENILTSCSISVLWSTCVTFYVQSYGHIIGMNEHGGEMWPRGSLSSVYSVKCSWDDKFGSLLTKVVVLVWKKEP